MLWIERFPIPPSANVLYETNVTRAYKINKRGDKYMGFKTSRRKGDELIRFQTQCLNFRNLNLNLFNRIIPIARGWVAQGYVLRVDTWFAFEHSRLWTKENTPKQLDADNRRKALQDAIGNILGIDDKWFFSGNVEKVTCSSKELEQCIIRITPMKARTLLEINSLKNTADSILHF